MSRQTPARRGPAGEPSVPGAPVTCCRCGMEAAPGEGDPPLAWSCDQSAEGKRWVCPVCTRDNVRAIEGKLDETWWGE